MKRSPSNEKALLLGNEAPCPSQDLHSTDFSPLTPNSTLLTKSKTRWVVLCILMCELCERMTYYSILGNLVLFLTNKLDFDSAGALTIQQVFSGVCYFMPLLLGWLADSVVGRYNTIFASGLIYIVGSFILPVVAADYEAVGLQGLGIAASKGIFISALVLITIGTGGIKANVGPFGAQQVEHEGEEVVSSFFNWFYWFINVGSFIAYAGVSYVQQEISFFVGYIIPAITMVLAVVIFVIGRHMYIITPPEGSVLTQVFKIIMHGFKRKSQLHYKDISAIDHAKSSNGGLFPDGEVENVKSFGGVIPVLLTLIIYWLIYAQMSGTYLVQAERMNLQLGSLTIPAAALNIFNTIIILILVPFLDRIVYPIFDKCCSRPSQLVKMGFGMILAAISVIVAGGLEIARKDELSRTGGFSQEVGGKMFNSSHISVLWQIPQFMLVGSSEVFTSISSIEFAYSEAPPSLKGLVMGMNLVTTGLGNFLGAALVNIVNAFSQDDLWFPSEINDGHVENFFFVLALLMGVNFIIYVVIARNYTYMKDRPGNESKVVAYAKSDSPTHHDNVDMLVHDTQ